MHTVVNILSYTLVDVQIVILVKGDFVGIEDMTSTSNGPQCPREDIAFSIVLINESSNNGQANSFDHKF